VALEPWTCNFVLNRAAQNEAAGEFVLTFYAGDIPYDVDIGLYSAYNPSLARTRIAGVVGGLPAIDAAVNVVAQAYNLRDLIRETIRFDSTHVAREVDLICKNVLVKRYVSASPPNAALPGMLVTATILDSPWIPLARLADDGWTLAADGLSVSKTATTNAAGEVIFTDVPADALVRLEVDEASAAQYGLAPNERVDHVRYTAAALPGDPAGTLARGQCRGVDRVINNVASGAQILGVVWNDLDGDGVIDPGEPVDAGVNVYLHDHATGVQLQFTQTDANGQFLFTNLAPGNYQLRVDNILSGRIVLTADDKDRLDFDNYGGAPDGRQRWFVRGADAGRGIIGGRILKDDNRNGNVDPGETAFAGVVVELWRDADGDGNREGSPPDVLVATTTANANGVWSFGDVPLSDPTDATTAYFLRIGAAGGNAAVVPGVGQTSPVFFLRGLYEGSLIDAGGNAEQPNFNTASTATGRWEEPGDPAAPGAVGIQNNEPDNGVADPS
jgi:hypothetical protein